MEEAEYDNIARLEATHWWYAGMRAIARSAVSGLALPAGARILDAGCGTGDGLRWLAAFGVVVGIDLHPAAIRHAVRVSTRLARASIQALPHPAGLFDLVTSFEVLYHLAVRDDVGALREFARVLRPGGWLLLRVPAHDWLRGAHDRQVHTRHRYSAGELRARLAAAGFQVVRLTPLGAWLLPAALARRLMQRRAEAATDVRLPAPALNAVLTRLLAAEAAWLRLADVPFGLSLLALARKPDTA